MKFSLIEQTHSELFTIQRRDAIHGRVACAAIAITALTIDDLFRHPFGENKESFEAKGLVYRDELDIDHVRFWNEGSNQDCDVHHQDALADLLYEEAESFTRLASLEKNELYRAKAHERLQLAQALNALRHDTFELYPEDLLLTTQGFKFIRASGGKVIAFAIDSGITRAQIKNAVVLDGQRLSAMVTLVHQAISPELRAYTEIRVSRSLKIKSEVALPDGLALNGSRKEKA